MSSIVMLKDHPNILGRPRKKGAILEVPANAAKAFVEAQVAAYYAHPAGESAEAKAAISAAEDVQAAKTAKAERMVKKLSGKAE